jgi:hypothetical protein
VDEVGAVAAGVAHVRTGTYFAYRVNPPLSRIPPGAILWAADAEFDSTELRDDPWYRCELPLGRAFAAANRERYLPLVRLARLTGLVWSVIGGVVVFAWARSLFGAGGGLVALGVWCFNPVVIGLAAVVVPDLPAAVAALVATYAFRAYLQKPTVGRALLAGLLLGAAELTKFTLLVLYPVYLVLWLVVRPTGLRCALGHGFLITGGSLIVVNAGYEFTGTGTRLGTIDFVSRPFAGDATGQPLGWGNRFRGTSVADLTIPVPVDFLRGIDTQWRDMAAGRPSYLRGEWRTDGWWYYYLYALGVKLPLGSIGLIITGAVSALVAAVRRSVSWAELAAVWLPPTAILILVSAHTEFNHHMRYVLPAVPFLAIGAGASGMAPLRAVRTGVPAALLAWTALATVTSAPHFLSYFNEAAGGPNGGPDHLADSNVDWGQDLLRLKRWLDAHHPPDEPLGLVCHNSLDPAAFGIRYVLPPPDPRPGRYAISAHYVCGGSFLAYDGRGRLVHVPAGRYAYFRYFRPVAKAGYSVFLYELTPEAVDAARSSLGLPPLS